MCPPNARELVGPQRDLHPDEQDVLDHFLGKNQEQAREYFRGRGHFVTECFYYMTIEGLRYYLPPFFEYLKSGDAKYEFLAGAGILSALANQIETKSPFPDDVLQLKEISAYVKQHCKRYLIDPHDEQYQSNLKIIQGARRSSQHS